MSSIGTGYDLSASQFSPDGKVFQVEYAQKAVENSGTVIGLRGKDGVVLAVEKLVTSKLYEQGANKRIFNIDKHIGMAVCGLISDARSLVDIARQEASKWRNQFGSPIPLKALNNRLSMYVHAYTLYSAIRPFGCNIFLSSYTPESGPEMYMIDPSGVSYRFCSLSVSGMDSGNIRSRVPLRGEDLTGKEIALGRNRNCEVVPRILPEVAASNKGYFACAAGKAKQTAKTELEKLKLKNMTCKELVMEAARIIYLVHDELKDKQFELELSWVCSESKGIHGKVPQTVFAEAEKLAKDAMEADSDSDDDMSSF